MEQLATISVHSRLLQLWLFLITLTVNMSAFYSFGVSAGDTQMQRQNDASSGPINLTVPIPFFGRLERILYVSLQFVLCSWTHYIYCIFSFNDPGPQVNTNGILSFGNQFIWITIRRFPLAAGRSLIAPFWDDVDTRRFGTIYYRETSNATLLQRARDQLRELFPSTGNFTPTQLFIATWDRVAEFGQNGSQVSTCTIPCLLGCVVTLMVHYYKCLVFIEVEQARRQGGGSTGFARTPLLAPKRFYIHCYSTF